jgi:hypothetical protein
MSDEHRDENSTEHAPDDVVDVTNEATDANASTPDLPTLDPSELVSEPEQPVTAPMPPVAPVAAAMPQAMPQDPQPVPPPAGVYPQAPQAAQVQWVGQPAPYAGSPFQAPRVPRPVIGPALSVFGMLLWTFVVAGQFTTSWMSGAPLSEGAAIAIVFFGTITAWFLAVRRSQVVPVSGRRELFGRSLAIGVIAFLLFVGCVVIAVVAGGVSSSNHDLAIALFLLLLSGVAAFFGPRITSPIRPARTSSQQLASVALWIGAMIVSAIACAELAANG